MNQTLKTIEVSGPTVAVIIPYYNGGKWIERAIKSVVAQTIPPSEFIIVNDGSKPEERETLAKLAQTYPFTILDKENGGQGSARNAGVKATTAAYISFLDQDDFYLPNHIEDLLNAVPKKDDRFGFVYADLCIADANGTLLQSNFVKNRGPHPKHSITDLLSRDMYVLPSATIISRRAFEAINGFDDQFMGYEDDDLFMRIFLANYSNYWLDKSVTIWCIHGDSTSYGIRMIRSRFKYFTKLLQKFPDNPTRDQFFFRDCIAPRFGPHFLADAMNATLSNSNDKIELVQLLKNYAQIVRKNQYTSRTLKLKFTLFAIVLTHMPLWAIKVTHRVATHPSIRRRLAMSAS